MTPDSCSQLLQAAAAAAAATTDPLQQQAILQQFAAQGVAIAQVGLLQPQFTAQQQQQQQQHGMQVQQDNSMMGTTVTTSAAAAMHLATVQQMQQYQQQQQIAVLGQGVAGKMIECYDGGMGFRRIRSDARRKESGRPHEDTTLSCRRSCSNCHLDSTITFSIDMDY